MSSFAPVRQHSIASSTARVVLAALCVVAHPSAGIAEQLAIKSYNAEAGLAHNRVKRIVQDSHGFLWFCTADGLSRFDGAQFTNYRFEDGLQAPSINDLLEAGDGVYWVATNSVGVVHFDLSTPPRDAADLRTRFVTYPISREPVTNRVNVLHRDRRGTLWAGTDGGLFRLAVHGTSFEAVPLEIPGRPDIQVQVWAVVEDRDGRLWIGTRFGLVVRTPAGRMLPHEVFPTGSDDNVSSLAFEPNGRLWLGHRSGLLTFVPDVRELTDSAAAAPRRIPANVRRYTTKDGLDNDHVVALHRSADGSIWVRTFGAGLSRFDGVSLRTYLVGPRSGEDVLSVTEDRDRNLWTGTRTAGALKITIGPWTNYNTADGLGEVISGVLEDNGGDLYVTSSGWRVSRFDGRDFTTVRLPLRDTVSDESWRNVTGVIKDHVGEWWAGSREGLYRFAASPSIDTLRRSRRLALYTTADGLASDDVTRVFEDASGDIWLGSWVPLRDVVVRWERSTGTFHRYSDRDGLQPFTTAQVFASDASGDVWIGFREGGVARYRNGRFAMLGREDGVPAGAVNGMYLDPTGRLWVTFSGGGLGRIDHPGADRPRILQYTAADGLTTNLTLAVTGDAAGRIYVTGSRGIDRLDPSTRSVRHYSTADGLAGGEFQAAFRDRAGTLWFGTSTGLSRFKADPDTRAGAPPALIGALRIAGVNYPVSALGQASVGGLALAPGKNNVQIDFFGIGFRPGEELRYSYRLAGASAGWSQPTAQRNVTYANLAAGSYVFEVQAVARDGTRSAAPATVAFTILPPIWRRWWFLTLMTTATLVTAAVVARSRHERIQSLRESENRFRTLAETASDPIITIDEDSRIVLVNRAAEAVFGYTVDELIGADLGMLMPERLREAHHAALRRYTHTRQRKISWRAVELPGRHKDGHEIPLELSFGEFTRNGRLFFTGIARDVTERNRAEEALRRSREERLAELERVRKRIATDLHDDIGSSLTRICLLSEVAGRRADGEHEALNDSLASIASLSRQLVDSMSDIVWAINPERDHLSDLSQRMRHFVSDLCTARDIDFRFDTPAGDRDLAVGANVRREVFLLFKEAVTNMARHAGCSQAELEFRADNGALFLRVADNGRGFDGTEVEHGHGLANMQRRAEALGGHCTIDSAPRRGTIVTFVIPLGDRGSGSAESAPAQIPT